MRINKFVALATGTSRRKADDLVSSGQVSVNGQTASMGLAISDSDQVYLNNTLLRLPTYTTILLNKPVGYVCSRDGQGSKTIYELLPKNLHHLKSIGRLDKDSCGLLVLTNDGDLAEKLTHPSNQKQKTYRLRLDQPITQEHREKISRGVNLEDGISALGLTGSGKNLLVSMHEGRNRQIRRTFAALGYTVVELERLTFGPWKLDNLRPGDFRTLDEARDGMR